MESIMNPMCKAHLYSVIIYLYKFIVFFYKDNKNIIIILKNIVYVRFN